MSDSSSSPQPSVTNTVNTVISITNACNFIVGFTVNSALNDGGSWFTLLTSSLQQVQDDAHIWLGSLSTDFTTTVPSDILNLDPTVSPAFINLLSPLQTALGQVQNMPSPSIPPSTFQTLLTDAGLSQDQADSFNTTLTDLNFSLNSLWNQLSQINTQLDNLQNSFSQDQSDFNNVQLAVSQEEKVQQQDITALETLIGQLQTQVCGSSNITSDEINAELAQISANPQTALAMLQFKEECGPGPELYFNDPSQAQAYDQSISDQVQANNEIYSYASVLLLSQTVTQLQQQIGNVSQSMSYVVTAMNTVIQKMEAVNGFMFQATVQNGLLLIQVNLQAAQTAWNNLVTYTKSFQSAYSSSS
jgi:uncharacterized coiled-coil protein SlyX